MSSSLKIKLKNLLCLLALAGTFVVSVATSIKQTSYTYGVFWINSDCVTPSVEEKITVEFAQVTSPSGTTFLDYGLPTETIVSDESDMTGLVDGETRTCKKTFGDFGANGEAVYTCFERDTYRCTILIREP